MKTPASLLERLRHPQDEEAWRQFVDLYTPLLFYWARRAHLPEEDAADLVQDVFTILVRKLPEFAYDRTKGFRRWLHTVTLNKWRERMRRQAHAGHPVALNPDKLADTDPVEGFWEEEYRQFLVTRARQLIQDQIEPASWQAFWKIVVENRRPEEVAAELGLTRGAVYSAKYRTLVKLRQALNGLMD